jgi:hypothetical protein
MNKLLGLFVFIAASLQISAQTHYTALKITPEYPMQGRKLSFEYNKNISSLIKQPTVEVVIYQFTENGVKALEPVITKKGAIYSGSITLDSNTNCIAFDFFSGKEKDMNGSKGYIVPVYKKNKQPVDGYYAWVSSLYNGYGEYLFRLPNDADKGLAVLEEGLKENPVLKNDIGFFSSYLNALSRAKKKEAAPFIAKELENFEAKGNLKEAGYYTLIQWYNKDKKKAKADSLTIAMKVAFPEGDWKKNEAGAAFYKEKDDTFQGEWTKSGDKYSRDVDGYYTYAGRNDDMLKVSGIYVSPFEVESTLVQHPAILEAAVIGKVDADGLTKTKAFIVLKAGQSLAEEDIKVFVKERLAPYKYPRFVEFVTELPKTATGKIQRFRLRDLENKKA